MVCGTWISRQLVAAIVACGALSVPARAERRAPRAVVRARPLPVLSTSLTLPSFRADSLAGYSGKLLARFVPEGLADFYQTALAVAGEGDESGESVTRLNILPLIPFSAKQDGWVGMYRMGFWPAETRGARTEEYENPAGFIEVTPQNAGLRVSEHFRLRDFVTKDQHQVWPKYLVLREVLLDKLELLLIELQAAGYDAQHVHILSGFRHPHYNELGVRTGGRALDSRHQFGDAADIMIDSDFDGRMDDLDRDGVVSLRDADIVIAALNRIESTYPALTGGIGRYRATNAHAPFVHVDVRGMPARWGGAW
jgi:uncharacterized protein YcbK (DUF882 family)